MGMEICGKGCSVAFCQNSLITCDKEPKYIVYVCEMSAVCVGAPDSPGKKKFFFLGGGNVMRLFVKIL